MRQRFISVALVMFALVHFADVNRAMAVDQTYNQWYTALPALYQGYIPDLTAAIKANVTGPTEVKPTDYTYGDPATRAAMVQVAIDAINKKCGSDIPAAVAAWEGLFRANNILWAHAAGYAAEPAVLKQVATFWLAKNTAKRDSYTAGTGNYKLWDAAVTATNNLIKSY